MTQFIHFSQHSKKVRFHLGAVCKCAQISSCHMVIINWSKKQEYTGDSLVQGQS